MAPQWAAAVRPLVLVFTGIAFLITWVFQASVDAQGGAYATGVLVLMTSASVAVTLSARRRQQRWATIGFGAISAVLVYTTVVNVIERPDGVRIAGLFILGIMTTSLLSRLRRSFELRATSVVLDSQASDFVMTDADEYDVIRIISHEPDEDTEAEYRNKSRDERRYGHIPAGSPIIFLEVYPSDSSDFEEDLQVRGIAKHGYRILQVTSGNVPNTIAAVLLEIRDHTGLIPEIYFEWTQGNPISNMFKFLFTGMGEIAPVTREVLREAEPNAKRRPSVHVS
jgi:hypothetical protein